MNETATIQLGEVIPLQNQEARRLIEKTRSLTRCVLDHNKNLKHNKYFPPITVGNFIVNCQAGTKLHTCKPKEDLSVLGQYIDFQVSIVDVCLNKRVYPNMDSRFLKCTWAKKFPVKSIYRYDYDVAAFGYHITWGELEDIYLSLLLKSMMNHNR